MRFQFLRTDRSQNEPYQDNIGDEEGFQIHIKLQQPCQLVKCEQGRCLARAENREPVSLASFVRFPGILAQFARIICTVYHVNLLKIINHDHPLTVQKELRISPLLLNEPY